eukprot:CAMPEP_0172554220 /NCGR_PEP_ID=MMETSP1067-20121228/53688_1 /TAXON_ID=265564 ORGANISM="Thalassiosira punctigera, Strain Tpunct2005C2" /NCGR_SAMPLE_ID=MMETSP1067 /ASSEMBLY_ACC=CAM_ASM_000444 /LENGTH=667 /DNA_ID=CAMNT_0013342547 /DNA_START=171 /DNA_END=2174 /DNA_ORIENTATION=+
MARTQQTQAKGQPDREIYNLFTTLNQEQQREKHDINGLYEGRLRSHVQNFEGLKRKWEGFTGVPVPKKLRTSELDAPNQPSAAPDPDEKPEVKSAKKVAKKATATSAKAAPPKNALPAMPSHPDDKINVDVMLVNPLRKELKKRGLAVTGRKVELQAKLRQHLAEAKKKREAEWAAKHAAKRAGAQLKQVRLGNDGVKSATSRNVKEIDVVMEDATQGGFSMNIDLEKVEPAKKPPLEKMASSQTVVKDAAAKPTKESATVGTVKNVMNKQAPPKSALKPSKYTSSVVQISSQLDDAKSAAKPVSTTLTKDDLPASNQKIPNKVSDSSSESSYEAPIVSNAATTSKALQQSGQKAKMSSTLAHTAPGGSAFKAKAGATGSASAKLLEKKKAHAAASEARKARMAEMRQKAKPNAVSASSATKPTPSHSKYAVSLTLKKMASGSNLGESKPNSILAKMREKAAAEKHTENAVAPSPKPTETTQYSSSSSSSVTSASSAAAKRGSQVMMMPKPVPKSTALKSILDPANKLDPANDPSMSEPPTKPELVKTVEKPLSPMQTYEMSDREEESSDSESESDEEYEQKRPKKAIPDWAQKANLHRALERQFADGPSRLDPDKIFGEVVTCNLEEIFDKKKSRYQRRTSSGNWTKDHVTIAEKLTYKRTMGYDK